MNSTKSKLLITAGLFAAVAVASGVSQRCSAKDAQAEGPLFTGHLSTQWHTMRPVEKGWIGGIACGRLRNGDQQGVFSATYDPATITSTGQAVYRLQDNVMNGKRSVETGNMSVSQVGADLILADCAYVGLL